MRSAWLITAASLVLAGGCGSIINAPHPRTEMEQQMFGPASMRLETFSKLRDWSGDKRIDGIEALVEFDDQFGDRTKAAGKFIFELYEYRPGYSDPRGARVDQPWDASLMTYDEQQEHWERASGAYIFRLAATDLDRKHSYVLTAEFQSAGGARYFSRIILAATEPMDEHHFLNRPRNAGPNPSLPQS